MKLVEKRRVRLRCNETSAGRADLGVEAPRSRAAVRRSALNVSIYVIAVKELPANRGLFGTVVFVSIKSN